MKPMTARRLGWKPEIPDHRDTNFKLAMPRAAIAVHSDLRPKMPPVVDQLDTGSCPGNARAGLLDFLHPDPDYKSGVFMPSSRRWLYYQARVLEGGPIVDEGAYIRDVMKSMATGVPHELACRFSEAKINTKPNPVAYTQAERRRKIASYHPLDTVLEMRACLSEGFPFVGGIAVFESFMSDDTAQAGYVNLPKPDDQPIGGHAICFVGHDDSAQRFIFRNSWGDGWGMLGYGTIPYAYVADRDLSDDFWTARL